MTQDESIDKKNKKSKYPHCCQRAVKNIKFPVFPIQKF